MANEKGEEQNTENRRGVGDERIGRTLEEKAEREGELTNAASSWRVDTTQSRLVRFINISGLKG